jgi:hypothetical protein
MKVHYEMPGVELSVIACQINIAYGSRIEAISPYEFKLKDFELGEFKIKLDYIYLKKFA